MISMEMWLYGMLLATIILVVAAVLGWSLIAWSAFVALVIGVGVSLKEAS